MNALLGPADEEGRIPARQQTRVAAFLLSAHGAQARQLATTMPMHLRRPWHIELHAQYCREMEILSLLAHSTSWAFDAQLPFLSWQWEAAWVPRPMPGAADHFHGLLVDMAALGHAIHAGIRPAALLPENVAAADPFVLAMRRIEFESGRLMQAQILFLKGPELVAVRGAVSAAVERRHAQVRELWNGVLSSMDIEQSARHVLAPAPAYRSKVPAGNVPAEPSAAVKHA